MRLSSTTQVDGVETPNYARGDITPGIVHIGVGGFHRAHQAMYLDRLMNAGKARDWGIRGLGLLPGDAAMRDALNAQEGRYTLVAKHPDGRRETRVIGSIIDMTLVDDGVDAALAVLTDPRIRIVSLTITEGGYTISNPHETFKLDDPAVAADLADPRQPRTAFGLVTEALRLRREAGTKPFTVMSCDNLQANGEVAKVAFTSYARAVDPELADWIQANVTFPCSMVDRITPRTTDADREQLLAETGIEDAWPVVTEGFTQWVLEDAFVDGRPEWEDAGVEVTDDVVPYELMKLRLLNASHQAIAYLGHLMGYRMVHEAAQDSLFQTFLLRYMGKEAIPSLQPVPAVDLDSYCWTLLGRFANEHVADTIERLCAETSDRIPKFLVPVAQHNVEHRGPVECAALVMAAWARYAEGVDEHGEPIVIDDRRLEQVTAAARAQADEPLAFLRQPDLFGHLVDDEPFGRAFVGHLTSLHRVGARETLRLLVGANPD